MNVSSLSSLISCDIVLSIIVASIVLLVVWFILGVRNNNKKNSEHDKKLFKQPPPAEECPICFIILPVLNSTGSKYQTCCGKMICSGCAHAPVYDDQGNEMIEKICPFCRTPAPYTEEEGIERIKKRVEKDDAIAIYSVGLYYSNGKYEYPQDYTKALEYWHQAAELGHARAYCCIGNAYDWVGR